jgi:ribosomal protein L11 methyltransferase (prmA)
VHSGVLIPRPETEDLCYWIANQPTLSSLSNPKILDIGTGSGCIAITLSQLIKNAQTTAWDIAPEALSLAKENAKAMGVALEVMEQDALNAPCHHEKWDIVVSNPPYITPQEQSEMEANVLQFEPNCALFVPENNPLIFYKAITHYAQKALVQGGALFFEINPLFVSEMKSLLAESGFADIEVLIDRFGKERHVKGVKK